MYSAFAVQSCSCLLDIPYSLRMKMRDLEFVGVSSMKFTETSAGIHSAFHSVQELKCPKL
jgi:hypothetical protein